MSSDPAEAYLQRARAERMAGNSFAALLDLANVLKFSPSSVDALFLRSAIYRDLGKRAEALADCDRALSVNAGNWKLHYSRGLLLEELRRAEEALLSFERSLELNPNNPDALQKMGTMLFVLGRGEEALARCDAALLNDTENADIHNCKGATLFLMRRFDQALRSFDRARALQPNSAISNYLRAIPLLASGHLREGFEAYEWRRLGNNPVVKLPLFGQRELNTSEDPGGKRLLLYAEQGLGDTLQYARFAQTFAERGAEVKLAVDPALQNLLVSLGHDILIISGDGPMPEFDVTCPLLSAPHKLGITLETIPSRIPYLSAPLDSRAAWRARLATARGLRVGLAWSGNPKNPNDWARSIAFEKLRLILDVSGVTFISVQKTVERTDEQSFSAASVIDFREYPLDFSETAALISELDLVITVDTVTAHLAGALGKPVWILLSAVSDWRWFENRIDSPWYPTARLLRQRMIGEWEPVLIEVRSLLSAMARERTA